MVEQALEDEQPRHLAEIGLPSQQPRFLCPQRYHARGAHRQSYLKRRSYLASGDPFTSLAIVRAEAIVFVDHKSNPIAHIVNELTRFLQCRRYRLFAHDMNTMIFSLHPQARMAANWGRNIDGLDIRYLKHRGEIRKDRGYTKGLGSSARLFEIGVANRHDLRFLSLCPTLQMILADHSRTNKPYTKRTARHLPSL